MLGEVNTKDLDKVLRWTMMDSCGNVAFDGVLYHVAVRCNLSVRVERRCLGVCFEAVFS